MKRIDLKTGFLCNNNCLFCVQAHKKRFGNKETEELKEYLSLARREGYEEVVFTGGEPTIRPDIFDLVGFAQKAGFKVIQIQSNGRRFADLDFCRRMMNAGANQFALAIHGPSPDVHDFLTRAKGSFFETARGIRNLKKLKQTVLTNTVITKFNYQTLPQVAKLLIRLNVDQFQLAFVHALGNAEKNFDLIVPKKSQVIPYVKNALDRGMSAGMSVMTEAIPYCFLIGYEDCVGECRMPETKVFDFDCVYESFTKTRQKECKMKAPSCRKCRYFEECEGPWKEYPQHFGWNEFHPVISREFSIP